MQLYLTFMHYIIFTFNITFSAFPIKFKNISIILLYDDKKMEYYIAWWNVENLFDVEDLVDRPEYLKKQLKKELEGWDANILDLKLNQLAKIIQKLNKNKGPDLIGVCEIENESVLKKLLNKINISGRKYEIAHHDCKDKRGIDVAFIYDSKKFEVKDDYSYEVQKRTATRDIYQVDFKTKPKDNDLIIIGNHWPSRSGGVYKSEPYRIIAAETLAYWNAKIKEEKRGNASVLVMGDFNDEPFDRSMVQYALSYRSKQKVITSRKIPALFNLMWPMLGTRLGTYYYGNFPHILDQFLISKYIIKETKPFSVKENSVELIRFEELMIGNYNVPNHFGRPSKYCNTEGYSDHFPIGMILKES